MLNLNKVELTKKGQSINLVKSNQPIGEVTVNLNWNQQAEKKKGLLSSILGKTNGIDLDLGCLYELSNGDKGCVQALGNSFGSYNARPFIQLDGDDRTGAVSGGENIRINGNRVSDIKRLVVFAFIYEGAANWAQANGIVTLKYPGGNDIEVRLDDHRSNKGMCAIAMIENIKNETFKIERLVEYFNGHRELDKAYGWGMSWQAGSK